MRPCIRIGSEYAGIEEIDNALFDIFFDVAVVVDLMTISCI